jgi:hypothetical protein
MVSVICSFFLFMTLYPEVQAKAQAEIDLVVGSSRLPEVEDQERLPYVTALINEVYRCGSVNPQGIAHRLRVDDVHDGYFIPKNSLILPNIWYVWLCIMFDMPFHDLLPGIWPAILVTIKTPRSSILIVSSVKGPSLILEHTSLDSVAGFALVNLSIPKYIIRHANPVIIQVASSPIILYF